ncbi:MAG: hypothetical protein ABSE72_12865 [Bacteroidales bacterium]|jgi:hypothetical protein
MKTLKHVKKILTITLFVINILSFGQSDSLSGDLTRDVKQQYNPDLTRRTSIARKDGFIPLVCGVLMAGGGAAYIAEASNPYFSETKEYKFNTGVFYCVLGGAAIIDGIIRLGNSAVLVNRAKKITLTTSGQNIGLALNF